MAQYSSKAYSLSQLGDGRKNGGTKDHQKHRFEVLDRLRAVGDVSLEQAGQWVAFRTAWDEKLAAVHNEHWAQYFSEMVQALFTDLSKPGSENALSVFIEREKIRVLGDVPMLCLPGVPNLGDLS